MSDELQEIGDFTLQHIGSKHYRVQTAAIDDRAGRQMVVFPKGKSSQRAFCRQRSSIIEVEMCHYPNGPTSWITFKVVSGTPSEDDLNAFVETLRQSSQLPETALVGVLKKWLPPVSHWLRWSRAA